jgi:hypothetical protein
MFKWITMPPPVKKVRQIPQIPRQAKFGLGLRLVATSAAVDTTVSNFSKFNLTDTKHWLFDKKLNIWNDDCSVQDTFHLIWYLLNIRFYFYSSNKTSNKILLERLFFSCKMHQNSFSGRAPPGPAGRAHSAPPDPWLNIGEPLRGRKKKGGGKGQE